jgi:transcription factor S
MGIFCPKCGAILRPRKEGEKTVMGCSCGYVNKEKETSMITEQVKPKQQEERSMETPSASSKITMPTTEAECPKCHNLTAYYWTRQTRAADEGETKFHQCTKCNHKWREYQ